MKRYIYRTNERAGVIEAESLEYAFLDVCPKDDQIAAGAWAVVLDPYTLEYFDTRN